MYFFTKHGGKRVLVVFVLTEAILYFFKEALEEKIETAFRF